MGNNTSNNTSNKRIQLPTNQRLINNQKTNKSLNSKKIEYDTLNVLNVNTTGFDNGFSRLEEDKDRYAEIKKSLKFMYKNNFSSATFDDLCAHYIQSSWKNYMIKKLIKQNHQGLIEIIYSSLNNNSVMKFNSIELVLDGMKIPYRIYDLIEYKALKTVVNEFSDYDNLPLIFINDIYIGGSKNFQELIDLELIVPIVNKEYLNNCLNCNMIKIKITNEEPVICLHCMKSYTFFAKSPVLKNIWSNRLNSD